jgi:hypothetical protein
MNKDLYRLNTDKTAAVAPSVHWLPIKEVPPPAGVNLWLINKASGVSVKGQYISTDKFFDHWFPNPTFKKD